MFNNLVKYGGYAYAIRELSGFLSKSRQERMRELQRSRNVDMAIGIGMGAILGLTSGLLIAPKSGKETRHMISERTNEILKAIREKKEDIQQDTRFRSAAEKAREAKESVKAAAEHGEKQ